MKVVRLAQTSFPLEECLTFISSRQDVRAMLAAMNGPTNCLDSLL